MVAWSDESYLALKKCFTRWRKLYKNGTVLGKNKKGAGGGGVSAMLHVRTSTLDL